MATAEQLNGTYLSFLMSAAGSADAVVGNNILQHIVAALEQRGYQVDTTRFREWFDWCAVATTAGIELVVVVESEGVPSRWRLFLTDTLGRSSVSSVVRALFYPLLETTAHRIPEASDIRWGRFTFGNCEI